jgi:hypothetical protein
MQQSPEDNDPHGEHDFGAFEHEGQRIFWKIDYYAPDMDARIKELKAKKS